MSRKYKIGSTHKNRYGQEYIIIDKISSRRLKIEFVETGYITEMFTSNNKSVMDRSHKGFSKTMSYSIGDILENNRGEKVEVLDYRAVPKRSGSNRYEHLLRFIDTGYEVWADCYNFKEGKTLDRLKPTVHGIGSIGYPPEEVFPLNGNREYRLWSRIMLRCSDEYDNDSYEDVTCSEEWKRFDLFYEDVKKLPNYNLWKLGFEAGGKNKYEIDKDILIQGNRVYSKESCVFVEKRINAGFTSYQKVEDRERNRTKILEEMGINE